MSRRPDRVVIREYESHEALLAEAELLRAAAIEPVAGGLMAGEGGLWRLAVDAHLVTPALAVLSGEQDGAVLADYACPRCGSLRTASLPPYLAIGFGLMCVVSVGLAWVELWWWLPVAGLGWGYVMTRLEAAPHWRCLSCGHRFDHQVVVDRRAKARDDAPE